MLHIENDGQLITATDYWTSLLASRGLVYCSVNAGAIRVLLPPDRYSDLKKMRGAEYCILSHGPWQGQEGIEIMWEDHSDSPYALDLPAEAFNVLPDKLPAGREWVLTVWTEEDGRPLKALERLCYWRQAPRLPWLKPLR